MAMIDEIISRVLDVVMPKVAEHVALHSTHGIEGFIVQGTYDPTDGTASVCFADTVAINTDFGDGPVVLTRVPIATTHVGDQYGPIGDERVIMVPTQSGFIALMYCGPDDTRNAPVGERHIDHRNPNSGQTDVSLKLTNDGASGDAAGGFSAVGGSQHTHQTAGGISRIASDASQTLTDTAGTASSTLDAANQAITHTVGTATAKLDAIAKSITHQVGSAKTLVDGAGNSINHLASKIGLGDLASNLPASQAALAKADGSFIMNAVQDAFNAHDLQTAAALVGAGIPNAGLFQAQILARAVGALPIPSGSSVVRIAA